MLMVSAGTFCINASGALVHCMKQNKITRPCCCAAVDRFLGSGSNLDFVLSQVAASPAAIVNSNRFVFRSTLTVLHAMANDVFYCSLYLFSVLTCSLVPVRCPQLGNC